MKIIQVKVSNLETLDNSRLGYKDSELAGLMSSMKANGLLQPIGIKALPTGKYGVVWGNRRLMAAKKLGWDFIDAGVVSQAETEEDVVICHLTENCSRVDISLPEAGRYYSELNKVYNLTYDEIASRVGVTAKKVKECIDMFNDIPVEHRHKIKSHRTGTKKKAGVIGGHIAKSLISMRGRFNLNKYQFNELFNYAEKNTITPQRLRSMGVLLKNGVDIDEAIKVSAQIKTIYLAIPIKEKEIRRIERDYGMSIYSALYNAIANQFDTELKKTKKPRNKNNYRSYKSMSQSARA